METKSKDNIKIQIKRQNDIKVFAIFLSEFSFMFITAIIALIGLIFPSDHETTKYFSYDGPKWNSSSDPLIFTHISDLHITSFDEIDKYRALFRTAKKLNASFHLITGDLADNYKKRHFPKIGKQNEKDWKYYQELLDSELYNETILDVAGNHDMFGVISPLDKDFGYLDVSKVFTRNNTKSLEEFWLKNISVEGINFILVNPFNFPVVHPPYGFYPHPPKKLMNLLETEINKIGPCSILTHFPIDFFWWKKNKKGHSFDEIMKKKNVQYIFTGHTHPGKFRIKHYKYGGIEFIGTSVKRTDDFGIVTIDNGRLVYNRVKFNENEFDKYIMTYPVPIEQISKMHNFNDKNTEIRVISYKNETEDNLYIMGDFNGKLEFQRALKNGAKLYSMPLNVNLEGEYEIKFKAPGFEIERNFYVGKSIKIYGERKDLYKSFFRLIFISVIIILIFLLIIAFPIKIINFSFIDDWILGKKNGKCYYWILCFALCPLILNYRINTYTPKYFRIILIFFICYPLILPFHFFEPIKGNTGYSFLCFILIKKKLIYDEWAIFFNAMYYWLIISPIILTVSGFIFKQSCFYKFHFIYLYASFAGSLVLNFRFAGESVKFILLFFHPCFVIIPIILHILLYLSLCNHNKLSMHDKKENYNNGIINTSSINSIIN